MKFDQDLCVITCDMIWGNYFAKTSQPSGPLCLWQCFYSTAWAVFYREMFSESGGTHLHVLCLQVVSLSWLFVFWFWFLLQILDSHFFASRKLLTVERILFWITPLQMQSKKIGVLFFLLPRLCLQVFLELSKPNNFFWQTSFRAKQRRWQARPRYRPFHRGKHICKTKYRNRQQIHNKTQKYKNKYSCYSSLTWLVTP